jgi:hypothetical protein
MGVVLYVCTWDSMGEAGLRDGRRHAGDFNEMQFDIGKQQSLHCLLFSSVTIITHNIFFTCVCLLNS